MRQILHEPVPVDREVWDRLGRYRVRVQDPEDRALHLFAAEFLLESLTQPADLVVEPGGDGPGLPASPHHPLLGPFTDKVEPSLGFLRHPCGDLVDKWCGELWVQCGQRCEWPVSGR